MWRWISDHARQPIQTIHDILNVGKDLLELCVEVETFILAIAHYSVFVGFLVPCVIVITTDSLRAF